MIILRSPKGWTGPKTVDGQRAEGYWRAHQVPFTMDKPEHLRLLDEWMRSYRPEELFDADGRPIEAITSLAPAGDRRMSANPHANGGLLMQPLRDARFARLRGAVPSPGRSTAKSTRVMGAFLRDVMKMNADTRNFRVFVAGREQLQPAERGAGGDRPSLGRRDAVRTMTTGAGRPGDGDPAASTRARAGWRAIC